MFHFLNNTLSYFYRSIVSAGRRKGNKWICSVNVSGQPPVREVEFALEESARKAFYAVIDYLISLKECTIERKPSSSKDGYLAILKCQRGGIRISVLREKMLQYKSLPVFY